ncbi:MAG: putative transport system ATP-binding protein [Burkholderiales bacterium]
MDENTTISGEYKLEVISTTLRRHAHLLELHDVRRTFAFGHTTVQALRGINLRIISGEMVAVWGPSGSGKSTLMNVIGLVDRPSRGKVILEGKNIRRLNDNTLSDYRNRKIGFIFQSFNLMPVLNVLENVMLPLQVQGIGDAQARSRATALLGRVGLESFAKFRPDRLSGGQRQRTAIARALVGDPVLVIADEPTANLDSENSLNVIDLMQSMNAETGVTFVFSTHDPRLLDRVPRRIFLSDGVISKDEKNGAST